MASGPRKKTAKMARNGKTAGYSTMKQSILTKAKKAKSPIKFIHVGVVVKNNRVVAYNPEPYRKNKAA